MSALWRWWRRRCQVRVQLYQASVACLAAMMRAESARQAAVETLAKDRPVAVTAPLSTRVH